MPVPLHRSIGAKGAFALSFSAFLVPVLFVFFVDTFLLPTSITKTQSAYTDDMSAMQQAMFDLPKPRIAARDVKPEMAYMLGNPHLAARQEEDLAEEDPVDEDPTTRRVSRPSEADPTTRRLSRTSDPDRTTIRLTGPTTRTREDDDRPRPTRRPDDDDDERPRRRPKPKQVDACAWNRRIEKTWTTPLWLTLGLSAGSIAGILIAAFTSYQYGKASKGGAGAAGGAMGGQPPGMY